MQNSQPASSAEPVFREALHHHQNGRLTEAEGLYRQVLVIDPQHADSLHLLGVLAGQKGALDTAIDFISQAIAIRGDVPFFHNNIANVLRDQGKYEKALEYYERALVLKPDYAEALNNMGVALQATGRQEQAAAAFEDAIRLKPGFFQAHYNLGNIFNEQGLFHEALESYYRAIGLKPDYTDAFFNMGNLFKRRGMPTEAMDAYEQVLALNPDYVEALNNKALILKDQGRLDQAMDCYKKVLALSPNRPEIYSNLLLTMVYAASATPEDIAETAFEFGRNIADPLLRARPFKNNRNPDRRLRIGYISPDFRDHAVNYFFGFIPKLHDRQNFEVFAYTCTIREDHVTDRLKQDFDHWRDIRMLSDDEAADMIERDGIDVLIDLAGHTANNRVLVLARKPAPVQMLWLGYPATTGMKAMDYRITDACIEPPGLTEHLNVESLWRLPHVFTCYQPHEKSPSVIDHPPFDDNGYITFGCFNNFAKVTDPVLEAWSRIMGQVPNSRLLLEIMGIDDAEFRAQTEQRFRRLGLPLDRIILEPRKKSNQFVLYNRIDIALDPFPCSGGTTSMDTLWMGVPFVTLAGRHYVSRMGVPPLVILGLEELVISTADEYVDRAVKLALDREHLRAIRHNLRGRMQAGPLMDQAAFTKDMEDAYRAVWRKWCSDPE
jgi:predicted O-linked N-acetylglucosamine transferase (SPINDLY family)